MPCVEKAHHLNRKRRRCVAPERRAAESAAVEPSRTLINNLLVYRSSSLKQRLQATEGCQRRRWTKRTQEAFCQPRAVTEARSSSSGRRGVKPRETAQTLFPFYI